MFSSVVYEIVETLLCHRDVSWAKKFPDIASLITKSIKSLNKQASHVLSDLIVPLRSFLVIFMFTGSTFETQTGPKLGLF